MKSQKSFISTIYIAVLISVIIFQAESYAKRGPVGLLIQVQGDVYHSYRGKSEKKVYRNMFLFSGSTIVTKAGSTCRLIDQINSTLIDLSENTEIQLIDNGIHVVKGNISEGPINGGLLNGIRRKYARAQRYSSIQRNARKKVEIDFFTAKSMTISKKYPDIVWENLGPEYTYILHISGKAFVIKPSNDEKDLVRYSLIDILPGQYSYQVEVVKNDTVVATSKADHQIIVLSDKEQLDIDNSGECLKKISSNNPFLQAYILDDKGLTVAAMDLLREDSSQNHHNNDTRLFLIKTYSDLELKKCKAKEQVFFYQNLND
ncbi:MAG: hypothetical protein HQK75_11215 [Candidatus Magnetomorum sp.]|nr:hypothetical protein [Candidatus Magnetomorum sp.]